MAGGIELISLPVFDFLPDTNIFVHYVRDSPLAQYIERIYAIEKGANSLAVSVVTVGELRTFALRRNWGKARLQRAADLLAKCDTQSY